MPGREYSQGPAPIHKHGLPVEDCVKCKLAALSPYPLMLQPLSALELGRRGPLELPTLNSPDDVYFCQSMQLVLHDPVPNKDQIRKPPGKVFQQIHYTTLPMPIQDHYHQCLPQL